VTAKLTKQIHTQCNRPEIISTPPQNLSVNGLFSSNTLYKCRVFRVFSQVKYDYEMVIFYKIELVINIPHKTEPSKENFNIISKM
jgi:hypothetical protein